MHLRFEIFLNRTVLNFLNENFSNEFYSDDL